MKLFWLPQQNYVLEQRIEDSSPRADRLSPTASASELTNKPATLDGERSRRCRRALRLARRAAPVVPAPLRLRVFCAEEAHAAKH